MRYVIGVDPGGKVDVASCGYAVLRGTHEVDELEFESSDITPFEAFSRVASLLTSRRAVGSTVVVAAERFTITQQSARRTRQNEALELIGALRHLCAYYDRTFLVYGASDAQRTGNRDVLRALGWWTPGRDHRNKAAAQVAHTLLQVAPAEFEQLVRPGIVI